jgi:hypothetical protein
MSATEHQAPDGVGEPAAHSGESPASGPRPTAVSASGAGVRSPDGSGPRRRGRLVRARLAAVSVDTAMSAGAIVGFALGLALGAISGALLVWFSGAVLEWQRGLSLTLGITRTLLPFGEQTGMLESINQAWFVVIPVASLIGGIVTAIFASLVGGLVAAVYNRTTRRASVLVEVRPRT